MVEVEVQEKAGIPIAGFQAINTATMNRTPNSESVGREGTQTGNTNPNAQEQAGISIASSEAINTATVNRTLNLESVGREGTQTGNTGPNADATDEEYYSYYMEFQGKVPSNATQRARVQILQVESLQDGKVLSIDQLNDFMKNKYKGSALLKKKGDFNQQIDKWVRNRRGRPTKRYQAYQQQNVERTRTRKDGDENDPDYDSNNMMDVLIGTTDLQGEIILPKTEFKDFKPGGENDQDNQRLCREMKQTIKTLVTLVKTLHKTQHATEQRAVAMEQRQLSLDALSIKFKAIDAHLDDLRNETPIGWQRHFDEYMAQYDQLSRSNPKNVGKRITTYSQKTCDTYRSWLQPYVNYLLLNSPFKAPNRFGVFAYLKGKYPGNPQVQIRIQRQINSFLGELEYYQYTMLGRLKIRIKGQPEKRHSKLDKTTYLKIRNIVLENLKRFVRQLQNKETENFQTGACINNLTLFFIIVTGSRPSEAAAVILGQYIQPNNKAFSTYWGQITHIAQIDGVSLINNLGGTKTNIRYTWYLEKDVEIMYKIQTNRDFIKLFNKHKEDKEKRHNINTVKEQLGKYMGQFLRDMVLRKHQLAQVDSEGKVYTPRSFRCWRATVWLQKKLEYKWMKIITSCEPNPLQHTTENLAKKTYADANYSNEQDVVSRCLRNEMFSYQAVASRLREDSYQLSGEDKIWWDKRTKQEAANFKTLAQFKQSMKRFQSQGERELGEKDREMADVVKQRNELLVMMDSGEFQKLRKERISREEKQNDFVSKQMPEAQRLIEEAEIEKVLQKEQEAEEMMKEEARKKKEQALANGEEVVYDEDDEDCLSEVEEQEVIITAVGIQSSKEQDGKEEDKNDEKDEDQSSKQKQKCLKNLKKSETGAEVESKANRESKAKSKIVQKSTAKTEAESKANNSSKTGPSNDSHPAQRGKQKNTNNIKCAKATETKTCRTSRKASPDQHLLTKRLHKDRFYQSKDTTNKFN